MKIQPLDRFRYVPSQSGALRYSKTLLLAFAVVFAAGVGMLHATSASAGPVLEIPQVLAPAADRKNSAPSVDVSPLPEEPAPAPSAVGSIEDYEHQDSSPYPAGVVSRPAAPIDPGANHAPEGNHAALGNRAIVGAFVLGVLALELHAADGHR